MTGSERTFAAPRPASVTIVLVFGWFSVAIDLFAGTALFILRGDAERLTELGVESATGLAVAFLVTALVLGGVLVRLGRGGSIARAIVTLVLLARVAVNVWAMSELGTTSFATSFVSVAVSIVALLFLWNRAASRFFATNG